MTVTKKIINFETYDSLLEEGIDRSFDWQQISVFDGAEPSIVLGEAMGQAASHILQNTDRHFAQELNSSAIMLTDQLAFEKYPLSIILSPGVDPVSNEPKLQILSKNFNSAGQKSEVLTSISEALDNLAVQSSLKGDILVIADELITNAIYNAPFVDLENCLPGAPRDNRNIKTPEAKAATLLMGRDSNRIVIGCKDQYGSLNFQKFLTRVKNCYDAGVAATMRMDGAGGAGIGSFMIFNTAMSFYVDIKKGVHTSVFCVLPLGMSNRQRSAMPKNLHFRFSK